MGGEEGDAMGREGTEARGHFREVGVMDGVGSVGFGGVCCHGGGALERAR